MPKPRLSLFGKLKYLQQQVLALVGQLDVPPPCNSIIMVKIFRHVRTIQLQRMEAQMRQLNYKHPFSKQRGVTLIEVLMSVLLMAIIGLGSAFIAARTAVTHRDQNVHLHTIIQMRNQLEASQCITAGTKTITVATTNVNL